MNLGDSEIDKPYERQQQYCVRRVAGRLFRGTGKEVLAVL